MIVQLRKPKFFIPKSLRQNEYDYFRSFDEEGRMENINDCNICLTPLNVPQNSE